MYVKLENIHFRYNRLYDYAVQDLTLTIHQGEFLSILGESGSGKSTVLRLIAGLEVPESGSIEIKGRTMVSDGLFVPPEKRGVGMVFQDYALFPHMTVASNVQFGIRGLDRRAKEERLQQVLHIVGLSDFRERYPYELSGGQQQRVALARALAPQPALLMLDEPFSNLDAGLREKIREEVHEILKQSGITTIFVTHDIGDAEAMADRIITMESGKLVQPAHHEDHISPPRTRSLETVQLN